MAKEGNCFIATLSKMTTKTTLWQCYWTGSVPDQTLDFVDLQSLLSEAQTSGISRVSGWECFGRNSCGWALHIRVCLCVWCKLFLSVRLTLCTFLQSCPGTEGLQSRQWVGVRAEENQENYHWLCLSAGTFHCFSLMYLSDFSQTKHEA